jgi:hypothetical protein
MTSVGVDCSQVRALSIDKQDNLRAGKIMIECGLAAAGDPANAAEPEPDEDSLAPLPFTNILVSNRTCSSSSTCTKSESMVWADSANGGQTIVDNYNDHNATYNTYSGVSYSTNGGATFTEIQPPPFATGHGTNFGDPIVVFNAKLNEWFAGDLVDGGDCGSQGIGLWTSTDGQTWTTGKCAHVGTSDDRESMWVDNETTSGVYGRMYISFNDFSNNNGALSLVHSDDGVTWSAPVILDASFIRDVQLTGSPVGAARYEGTDSTVFVASMDEGGGLFNTRQNVIYKSLDGGVTWTSTTTGARFNPPGTLTCNGYFAVVAPIWRHMGWGQPGVGPSGVLHYAYAGAGTNGDVGDIYYVRSTDNGRTWSTPIELNTDPDNSFHTQWMPSLSADKNGLVTVSWYDRRAATTTCTVSTDAGCSYERVGRQSTNNGVSFGAEITISTALIPQPTQTDSGVVACYAGDYDYDMTLNGNAYDSWTDGRRAVSGVQVQDVMFGNSGVITTAKHTKFDFDGDGKTDMSVFRSTTGQWFTIDSSNGSHVSSVFGASGDIPVPADYDGDGKTDLAYWHPADGTWHVTLSSTGQVIMPVQWGAQADGDIPMPGDYDGDGKADMAVFRQSTGQWFIIYSSNGSHIGSVFGASGDIPVPGDFDGDGKTDLAYWHPADGTWHVTLSSTGQVITPVQWGSQSNGDIPVSSDFDGDGKTDMAVFRSSTGQWFIIDSSTGNHVGFVFGASGDQPVTGDFDGDGKTDLAYWHPADGTWHVTLSSTGQVITPVQWGAQSDGDIPVPATLIH